MLEAFQKRMLADYFAGVTETLILIAKKNGKSSLLAALSLYHLASTQDAECVIAAASRDQAAILLRQARGFIRRSPGLAERMVVKQREIVSRRDDGRIRVLAADADTADGVIPTLALVDELHRHKTPDLYGVFRDGLGPRNGRIITISTAGDDELSPLGLMRSAMLATPGVERDGAYLHVRGEGFALHEWSLEPTDDLDDLELVKQANPLSIMTVEKLRARHDSPTMRPWQWARFACNVWVAGESSAISPVDWARRGDPDLTIADGTPIWLGIDLGWKWDTTALVPLDWQGEHDRRFGVPTIIVPPRDGTSTDPEVIHSALRTIHERTPIHTVVLDPNAGGEQLAGWIEHELGAQVVAHSQDPSPMATAAQRLSAAIREGLISHPADPEFTSHVLAAKEKVTVGEKWRLVKHRKPIDAVIAAAMVHNVAADEAGEVAPFVFEVFA